MLGSEMISRIRANSGVGSVDGQVHLEQILVKEQRISQLAMVLAKTYHNGFEH